MRDDLASLARKYRRIAELRRERAAGGEVAPREVLRALAEEHPGALNELDRLPPDVVEARAAALERAALGGPVEPWMEWMAALRTLYRSALRVKARLAGERDPGDAEVASIVARAAAEGLEGVDPALVRAVARPPRGRVRSVVLGRVAERCGVDVRTLEAALFPHGKGRALGPDGAEGT